MFQAALRSANPKSLNRPRALGARVLIGGPRGTARADRAGISGISNPLDQRSKRPQRQGGSCQKPRCLSPGFEDKTKHVSDWPAASRASTSQTENSQRLKVPRANAPLFRFRPWTRLTPNPLSTSKASRIFRRAALFFQPMIHTSYKLVFLYALASG